MLESLEVIGAVKLFIYIMLAFAFFVGILLLVSDQAFSLFNKDLQREYGIRKRMFPKVEDSKYEFIDFLLLKHRFISGLLISIIAFILLLLYK